MRKLTVVLFWAFEILFSTGNDTLEHYRLDKLNWQRRKACWRSSCQAKEGGFEIRPDLALHLHRLSVAFKFLT